MDNNASSPEEYVNQQEEILVNILKHSSNDFVRALALAALVEYSTDPAKQQIAKDLERLLKDIEG